MKALKEFYQFIQNISLDVVAGSVAMSFLFSKICNVNLSIQIYCVLGVCVWLIYTFDHLLDAKKIEGLAKTRRHRFHQLHYDFLMISWVVLLAFGLLFSIIFLSAITWYWGICIVLFSVFHFVLVHYFGSSKSKLVLKELGVSWSYTAGIVIGPFSLASGLEWYYAFSFILLFLVVLFNLIMFSYFDYFKDVKNKQASFAVNYGVAFTRIFLFILFGIITLLSSYALLFVDVLNLYYYFSICFLFSVGIFYFLMVVLIEHRSNSETFRKIGDAVFLLPFLLLFF